MVRVVVEIPQWFVDNCKVDGDRPADVILDLIDEMGDPPWDYEDIVLQADPPPPPKPAGRGWWNRPLPPEIAEFLRERIEPP